MGTLSEALRKHGQGPGFVPEAPDGDRPPRSWKRRLHMWLILVGCAAAGGVFGLAVLPVIKGRPAASVAQDGGVPESLRVPVQGVASAVPSLNASPPVPDKPAQPTFDLSGIVYDPFRPSALVNGRLVAVGDEVDGATVLSIERYRVVISHLGQTRELFLDR